MNTTNDTVVCDRRCTDAVRKSPLIPHGNTHCVLHTPAQSRPHPSLRLNHHPARPLSRRPRHDKERAPLSQTPCRTRRRRLACGVRSALRTRVTSRPLRKDVRHVSTPTPEPVLPSSRSLPHHARPPLFCRHAPPSPSCSTYPGLTPSRRFPRVARKRALGVHAP
ncbi:hypothetical protein OF83DRAFT_157108 [Amylostereum chailletii]|nr:hypothetical protein OF83DRAFT_157108 [Amylostereum chailletii]